MPKRAEWQARKAPIYEVGLRLDDQCFDAERTLAGQLRKLVELYARQGHTAAQAAERARAVVERALERV